MSQGVVRASVGERRYWGHGHLGPIGLRRPRDAHPGRLGRRGTPVSVVRLAAEQELPRKFLEAILADLRRSGLVSSRMGANGGYLLARASADITVGDVIRAVDGPLAEVRGERPQATSYEGAATHLRTVWVAVRSSVRSVLDGTSLADVLTGDFPDAVTEAVAAPGAWENR